MEKWKMVNKGLIGKEMKVEDGKDEERECEIKVIEKEKEEIGEIDRIKRIVKIKVLVD